MPKLISRKLLILKGIFNEDLLDHATRVDAKVTKLLKVVRDSHRTNNLADTNIEIINASFSTTASHTTTTTFKTTTTVNNAI